MPSPSSNHSHSVHHFSRPSLPLSKIHRLLRPLRSSIATLNLSLLHQARQQSSINQFIFNRQLTHRSIFRERKSQKRKRQEDDEYKPKQSSRPHQSKKPYRSNSNSKLNQLSSPLFHHHHHHHHHPAPQTKKAFYGQRKHLNRLHRSKSSSCLNLQDGARDLAREIELKIERILTAYKNIIDAVCLDHHPQPRSTFSSNSHTSSSAPPQNKVSIDRLTMSCARVIGRNIEQVIRTQALQQRPSRLSDSDSTSASDLETGLSLAEEEDWKTSVMDEWYDAIPMLYRRCALAQHALTLILIEFADGLSDPPPLSPSKRVGQLPSNPHTHTLLYGLHRIHRSYASPLLAPQAATLLPKLFALPNIDWSELYDATYHQFGLVAEFDQLFHQHVASKSFLSYWCDWSVGLVGFVDGAIHHFGTPAMEVWIHERETLISEQQSHREARDAGLESSSEDEANGKLLDDFDSRTGPVILKWLDSLVQSCLPGSVHCRAARARLNEISRLVFESLQNSFQLEHPFLGMLSLAIESHRLALFNLAIFDPPMLALPKIPAKHDPIRLLNVIRLVNNDRVFGKAAKVFLRAHRATRLLALVGRREWLIPGLDDLLSFVTVSDWAESLTEVARSWVECLLRTDPASWWAPTGGEDETRHVRGWLENWLVQLDAIDIQGDDELAAADQSLTLGKPPPCSSSVANHSNSTCILADLEDDQTDEQTSGQDVDEQDTDTEERDGPSKRRRPHLTRGDSEEAKPSTQSLICTCGDAQLDILTSDDKPDVDNNEEQGRSASSSRVDSHEAMWLSSRVDDVVPLKRLSQTPTPMGHVASGSGSQTLTNRLANSSGTSGLGIMRANSNPSISQKKSTPIGQVASGPGAKRLSRQPSRSTSTSASSLSRSISAATVLQTSSSMSDLARVSVVTRSGHGKGKEKENVGNDAEDVDFDVLDLLSRPRSLTPKVRVVVNKSSVSRRGIQKKK